MLAASLLAGCAGSETWQSENESEDAASSEQTLGTGFRGPDGRFLTPWASPGTINVCFLTYKKADGTAGTPNATLVTAITNAMQQTWQASSGITFSFRGTCPTTISSTWMSIFVDNDGSYFNPVAAMAGVGQRFSSAYMGSDWARLGPQIENRTDVQVYLPNNGQDWTLKTAHEVGHALGFYHEMERKDNGTTCMANANGNAYGHLTPYDPNSIMLWSYCPNNLTADAPLTAWDQLGAELLYPRRYTGERVACLNSCFETGSGVIMRSTGQATIEWIRRGADIAYLGAPVWKFGSTTIQPTDGILRASALTGTSTAVTMTFNDGYARAHSGSGDVTKSESAFTAVFGAISTVGL